jgi:hypothetical protein
LTEFHRNEAWLVLKEIQVQSIFLFELSNQGLRARATEVLNAILRIFACNMSRFWCDL